MSPSKDSIKGVIHEGIPQGKWEDIGGVDSYVATPAGDYSKDKVVLYLPDAFGAQLLNAQLLADGFAANGLKAIIPDYFNGDYMSLSALKPGNTLDIASWLPRHTPEHTRPILDKVLEALKAEGVTSIAATGYGFGARYTFDLAFEHIIKVAVISPSHLKIPEDLEKYCAISKAPLLINSCPVDRHFPLESCAKADEIFGNGKFAPGYKREFFQGCNHGFTVRGDLSGDPAVRAGKDASFEATVNWFLKYL